MLVISGSKTVWLKTKNKYIKFLLFSFFNIHEIYLCFHIGPMFTADFKAFSRFERFRLVFYCSM